MTERKKKYNNTEIEIFKSYGLTEKDIKSGDFDLDFLLFHDKQRNAHEQTIPNTYNSKDPR